MIGGLGSGKTRTGAEAAVDLALENPGCDGMIVAPTFGMFERLMRPAWEAALPKELIVSHSSKDRCYHLRGGRRVWYGTAEVPASLEGTNLAWFWGDEARYWPKKSHENMLARLRLLKARRLQGIYTTTPAMGWLEEEFNTGRRSRYSYRASTRENAHNLAPDYIENLERSYSPRLVKSLVDGHFTVIEGQVYEVFDDERHLIDWTLNPRLPVTVWMDFGVRKSSVLFSQHTDHVYRTPDGRELPPDTHIIFDELQPEQKPTERVIPLILDVLQRHGIRQVAAVFCDPAGRARDIASGMPSVHLLEAAFGRIVRYQTAPEYTFIPNGVAVVEGLLSPASGAPRLYLARTLAQRTQRTKDSDYSRGIYKTLRGLQYPQAKDGRPVSDHPLKEGHLEHCGDALRYGCVNSELWLGRPVGQQAIAIQRYH